MHSLHPPSSLRSGHLYIKDAECVESNEISYFRFLVFELLVTKEITIRLQKNYLKVAKFTGKIGIDLTIQNSHALLQKCSQTLSQTERMRKT